MGLEGLTDKNFGAPLTSNVTDICNVSKFSDIWSSG